MDIVNAVIFVLIGTPLVAYGMIFVRDWIVAGRFPDQPGAGLVLIMLPIELFCTFGWYVNMCNWRNLLLRSLLATLEAEDIGNQRY